MVKINIIFHRKNKKIERILEKLPIYHCSNSPITLIIKDRIELFLKIEPKFKGFKIELENKQFYFRKKYGGNFKEPIIRAIGLKPKENKFILDATAGCGTEAFHFLYLGAKIIMIENNPIIFLLLKDALINTKNKILKKISLIYSCSEKFLKKNKINPDVIYIDPMYTIKKKKSKPKKKMQILRFLSYSNIFNKNLLPLSLKKAKNRVVVKRLKKSNFLNNICPTYSIKLKKHRFDVYLTNL